jgi:hypothetical protein
MDFLTFDSVGTSGEGGGGGLLMKMIILYDLRAKKNDAVA